MLENGGFSIASVVAGLRRLEDWVCQRLGEERDRNWHLRLRKRRRDERQAARMS
jgi:hypothetical protein